MLLALLAAAALGGSPCQVTGTAPPADLEQALAGCERAAERFHLLYGVPAPRGVIEVSDTVGTFVIERHAPEWKLVWPNSARMLAFFETTPERGRTTAESVEIQWTVVLPHEIGHLLLVAEADARRPSTLAPRRLPDWLHEGTAVLMEPPAYRENEFALLRAHRPFVPPLQALLTRELWSREERAEAGMSVTETFFSCISEEMCDGRPFWWRIFSVTTRHLPDGRVLVDTVFHERPPPPPSPIGPNFYAYSATLVRYLFDRGGAPAMSALLDRYARSRDGRVGLAGLPGVPRSERGVQGDWEGWFREWVFAGGVR